MTNVSLDHKKCENLKEKHRIIREKQVMIKKKESKKFIITKPAPQRTLERTFRLERRINISKRVQRK